MTRIFYFLPFVILAGFFAVSYIMLKRGNTDDLPSTFIGSPAPQIQLEPMADMQRFTKSDLQKGQVSLVNFWASWCAPCRAEHPNLQDLADQGVPIFGINYKDNPQNAQAFLDELGVPYIKGGADPRGRMAVDWGVFGLPETFVIGPDGRVLLRLAGPLTQRNMQSRILPILQEQGLSLQP